MTLYDEKGRLVVDNSVIVRNMWSGNKVYSVPPGGRHITGPPPFYVDARTLQVDPLDPLPWWQRLRAWLRRKWNA